MKSEFSYRLPLKKTKIKFLALQYANLINKHGLNQSNALNRFTRKTLHLPHISVHMFSVDKFSTDSAEVRATEIENKVNGPDKMRLLHLDYLFHGGVQLKWSENMKRGFPQTSAHKKTSHHE